MMPAAARIAELEALVETLTWRIEEMSEPPDAITSRLLAAGVRLTPAQRRIVGLMGRFRSSYARKEALAAAGAKLTSVEPTNVETVDVQVCAIRRKFREARAPWAIETVRGVGYRLLELQ